MSRAGLGGSVGCTSDWRPGGRRFHPRRGRQHSFLEIDHEIFSMVILSLPLIQEGQLSVSGERMCTILVNRSADLASPVNVWLGKLPTLDMDPLGWMGHESSTQTNERCLGSATIIEDSLPITPRGKANKPWQSVSTVNVLILGTPKFLSKCHMQTV